MKLSTCCAALLLALASPAVLAAPGSCERIQSDISQRIINNGVPESSFTLSIVPNDQLISLIPRSSGIVLMIRIKFSTPAPPAVTSLLPRSLPRMARLPNRSNTLSTERRIRHIRRFEHTT